MRLLALCGSPRTNGNTAFLLNTIVQESNRLGHSAQLLKISSLAINECNGCLLCEETDCTGDCPFVDDMQSRINPAILSTDILILGTPSYFDLPTAILKRFMDRSNMILSKLIERHISFGVVVVGQSSKSSLNATYRGVKRYCKICGMNEVSGSPLLFIARNVNDAKENLTATEVATEFTRKLISQR